MQFKQGAEVFSSNGERVGTIHRTVIEPDTREITHLVIQKGLLFRLRPLTAATERYCLSETKAQSCRPTD